MRTAAAATTCKMKRTDFSKKRVNGTGPAASFGSSQRDDIMKCPQSPGVASYNTSRSDFGRLSGNGGVIPKSVRSNPVVGGPSPQEYQTNTSNLSRSGGTIPRTGREVTNVVIAADAESKAMPMSPALSPGKKAAASPGPSDYGVVFSSLSPKGVASFSQSGGPNRMRRKQVGTSSDGGISTLRLDDEVERHPGPGSYDTSFTSLTRKGGVIPRGNVPMFVQRNGTATFGGSHSTGPSPLDYGAPSSSLSKKGGVIPKYKPRAKVESLPGPQSYNVAVSQFE